MSATADSWAGRRCLVTGAGGFIGSHLVEELVRSGAHVRAFVRYTSEPHLGLLADTDPDVMGNVELVRGDIRDAAALDSATSGVSTVFHLAALIGIPYSYAHPRDVFETNTLGTMNVVSAVLANDVEHLVHTSSSEVYGTARYTPIDEAHPLQGQSPYSASKIACDKIVESFVDTYDLPATVVRPFNTYGPRQSARAVIPTVLSQVVAAETVRVGSLSPRRDFTFVSDTVAGLMAAGRTLRQTGLVVNLGTGSAISIRELLERTSSVVGRSLAVVECDDRRRPAKSEVMELLSDNRRAKELFGWRPQIDLEEGLKRTLAWIGDHAERYRVGTYEE